MSASIGLFFCQHVLGLTFVRNGLQIFCSLIQFSPFTWRHNPFILIVVIYIPSCSCHLLLCSFVCFLIVWFLVYFVWIGFWSFTFFFCDTRSLCPLRGKSPLNFVNCYILGFFLNAFKMHSYPLGNPPSTSAGKQTLKSPLRNTVGLLYNLYFRVFTSAHPVLFPAMSSPILNSILGLICILFRSFFNVWFFPSPCCTL